MVMFLGNCLAMNAVQRVSVVTGENIVFYENHIDTLPQYTLAYEMYQIN